METEIKDRFTELYKENQVVMDELSRFFLAFWFMEKIEGE